MSWLRRIFVKSSEAEGVKLVKLRTVRFRHLLRHYGKFLDLQADAAEKQTGEYVLDKQYILSMAEILFEVADTVVFDLNVMTNQRCTSFYPLMDQFHAEIKKSLTSRTDEAKRRKEAGKRSEKRKGAYSPASEGSLMQAIARYPLLYGQKGRVACRGVAAGPVFNLSTEKDPERLPAGAVLVATKIEPKAELLRAVQKAAAILTDSGRPTDQIAGAAREFRIPTIVGLQNASEQLMTGTVVTVDADENTVYLGRLHELLDYYREERLGPEEELEYVLLRSLRQAVFPLTIGQGEGTEYGIDECKTLHDIVHLAQEMAGETLTELVTGRRDLRRASIGLNAGFDASMNGIFLNEGQVSAPLDGKLEIRATKSLPLCAFASGVVDLRRGQGPAMHSPSAVDKITAIVDDEYAHIILFQPSGFDMVDSYMSESKESNYIYCRFIAGAHEVDLAAGRSKVAGEILSRLNFVTARTGRGVTGWIGNLPRGELHERLLRIGRLVGCFKEMDAGDWRNPKVQERVENFILHSV